MAINGHQWRPLTPLSERENWGGREAGRRFPVQGRRTGATRSGCAGLGEGDRALGAAARFSRGRTRPGGQAAAAVRDKEGGPRVGPTCKRESMKMGARLSRLGLLGQF
jgi:hypothetical protein